MAGTRPLTAALIIQVGVIGLALILAWVFGLTPWEKLTWSAQAVGWSVLATIPLAIMLFVFPAVRWRWAREITRLIEDFLLPLFSSAPRGSVVVVSALAGVGEELLFRGVIQDGLTGVFGPLFAVILASVLFGVAHAVSVAYFIIATLMGGYLGWLYLQTGNLLVPIVVHALYDWIAIHFYLLRQARRRCL